MYSDWSTLCTYLASPLHMWLLQIYDIFARIQQIVFATAEPELNIIGWRMFCLKRGDILNEINGGTEFIFRCYEHVKCNCVRLLTTHSVPHDSCTLLKGRHIRCFKCFVS